MGRRKEGSLPGERSQTWIGQGKGERASSCVSQLGRSRERKVKGRNPTLCLFVDCAIWEQSVFGYLVV